MSIKFEITKQKLRQIEGIVGKGGDKEMAKAITLLAEDIYEII